MVIYCLVGFMISWQAFALSLVCGAVCFFALKGIIRRSRDVSHRAVETRTQLLREYGEAQAL